MKRSIYNNWKQKWMLQSKWYRFTVFGFLCTSILLLGFSVIQCAMQRVPEQINLVKGEAASFDFGVPVMTGTIINQENTSISFAKPFTLKSNDENTYKMDVRLFGVLPLKKVDVTSSSRTQIIAGGEPIGIYVETDGVLVLGTCELKNYLGEIQYPAQNIVLSGDYIVAVNGIAIHYKSELIKAVNQSKGKDIILSLRRNGQIIKVRVKPVETKQKTSYQCGIWVRDDTQGIGTLTYQTLDGSFGALGHGVSDVDTGELMESIKGRIYAAQISYITKGRKGKPGELAGSIDYAQQNKLGDIHRNKECGIMGSGTHSLTEYAGNKVIPIGLKQEVKEGKAFIKSSVSGTLVDYEIQIEHVNCLEDGKPDLTIQVTDSRLLNLTGGIVQGMSGSPIIQDGKLIGAVTHVFVNDPTKGYGIFIEEMIN